MNIMPENIPYTNHCHFLAFSFLIPEYKLTINYFKNVTTYIKPEVPIKDFCLFVINTNYSFHFSSDQRFSALSTEYPIIKTASRSALLPVPN